ncbi:MAG TPA: hypothetical protein GXZ97_10745 [Hydrogenispora sp.]|jgi:hypothetical protein|nr:hypothetical protein [Hydrogenispora sp.]
MEKQLRDRLRELTEEFANGQNLLADLQRRERSLRETLLRISGAIQLLEEELGKTEDSNKVGEDEHAD